MMLRSSTNHTLAIEIDSCLFVNNTAQSDGGAISFSYFTPWIRDCTFHANHSSPGGGTISLVTEANIVLAHSIVSFSAGYGIVAWSAPVASPYFLCNDVYGNSSGNYGGLISDQTGTNNNISADPLFCNAPGDMSISTISPCAPVNSPCGLLIGRYGPFCGPNLVITAVTWWWTTTQPVGTTTYAVLEMQNTGDKDAGQFFVDFYRNRSTAPPSGLRGDSFGVIPGLAAGAPYAFQTSSMTSDTCAEWQSWFSVDTDNSRARDQRDRQPDLDHAHVAASGPVRLARVDGRRIPFVAGHRLDRRRSDDARGRDRLRQREALRLEAGRHERCPASP